MGTPGRYCLGLLAAGVLALCATDAAAQWVKFSDETSTRLAAPASAADTDEKDYAWGDVDNDGDIDLVVVRKEPFTSPGRRVNHLLINEGGVLTDRTLEFATAAQVTCCGSPADQGFNTPTNDRDVQLVDLDLDGWLDIVTATTISDGLSKHIGHPRIYRNLGCSGACAGTEDWLGFRYEEARIPAMQSYSGWGGFNPRFCSVAVGDVTGDGYPDLWFGDYDSSGAGGSGQPPNADFNDRLLINLGVANPGYFVDQTNGASSRFTGMLLLAPFGYLPFQVSAFGAAGAIADLNGDGLNDILKQTALDAPTYVAAAFNDPGQVGYFGEFKSAPAGAPYFVSVAELNNDGRLDLIVSDDGADRYLLNQGNDAQGRAEFLSYVFSFSHSGPGGPASDDGFASNSVAADLNNDGWNDVLISDVDVDIGGCGNRMHVYRNLGGTGAPGAFVTLQEQTQGANCNTFFGGNPACSVVGIPTDRLTGMHDVAVFDLNQDGWQDLILGRCGGTQVYINIAEVGSVHLDRPVYGCAGSLQITVDDLSLVGQATTTADVWSDSEAAPETVTLTETDPGTFVGSLDLAGGPPVRGDGLLSLAHADELSVEYVDADDGAGGTDIPRLATAVADCQGPTVSGVQIQHTVTAGATVQWQTDEPSTSVVHFGNASPDENTVSNGNLVTSHSVWVAPLLCAEYLVSISSADQGGNVTDDDDDGNFYRIEPLCDPVPEIPDGGGGSAPVTVDWFDATGMWIFWDNQCNDVPAKVVYGPLDQVGSYAVTGALCDQPEVLDAALWPKENVPAESLWFLVLRDNGVGVESHWGHTSDGERNPGGHSGQCGAIRQEDVTFCVP